MENYRGRNVDMKQTILAITLAVGIQMAWPATMTEENNNISEKHPVPQEYYRRFVAAKSAIDDNIYWLDSTTGQVWKMDRSAAKWENLGRGKGMTPGSKGTYILWADNRVYVLHTGNGKGWVYDGNNWEIIEPIDPLKENNS
jgi:hypothetical protein